MLLRIPFDLFEFKERVTTSSCMCAVSSVWTTVNKLIKSKATAKGDLKQTVKEQTQTEETLASAHSNSMKTAADHEQTSKACEDELKVIAEGAQTMTRHIV